MARRNNMNNYDNSNKNQNYEKGITKSKLMVFFDWVWRLFILNTLTIATSLGVITLFPSVVACFRTLKECYEEDEQHVVKRFYANFVYCFLDTVGVGVLFLVILLALGYSFFYYIGIIEALIETGSGESWVTLFWFLFFFSLVVYFVVLIVYIQLPMVVTYFRFRFFDKIKFAFYMAFKYFGVTLEEFLLLFMWSSLVFVIWPYVPVIFVFVTTVPLLLNYLVSRRCYWSMVNNFDYSYEEDKYDLQNKTQNRETYEDDVKTSTDDELNNN